MEDIEFDRALVAAAFDLIAERGWRRVSVADAARRAGVALERARERFPGKAAILGKFGRLADMAALGEAPASALALADSASVRDTLFGMMMRRIDVLQAHRDGVLALLRELPGDPATALMLSDGTRRSMAWLLDGAGIGSTGLLGAVRVQGLVAVWLWTVRAWRRDEGMDLSATMAALDNALRRAEQVASMMPFGPARNAPDEAMVSSEDAADRPGTGALAEPLSPAAAPLPPEPPVGPPV